MKIKKRTLADLGMMLFAVAIIALLYLSLPEDPHPCLSCLSCMLGR